MSDDSALERMTAMQRELESAQAEQGAFAEFLDKLSDHLDRVDRLRSYEGQWMEDRTELLEINDDRPDLPILGEDPLWELQKRNSELLRQLLSECSVGLGAEHGHSNGAGSEHSGAK